MEHDETEITEYIRKKVQTFEPEAGNPEWSAQVESIVDEVVGEVDPNTPREQSKIAEWVRSIAKNEERRAADEDESEEVDDDE
jgi:hypothetical protein